MYQHLLQIAWPLQSALAISKYALIQIKRTADYEKHYVSGLFNFDSSSNLTRKQKTRKKCTSARIINSLTFKNRSYFKYTKTSDGHHLSQGQFHQEHRHPSQCQRYEIWNQKCPTAIFVAQVRKSPQVSQPYRQAHHGQDELDLKTRFQDVTFKEGSKFTWYAQCTVRLYH